MIDTSGVYITKLNQKKYWYRSKGIKPTDTAKKTSPDLISISNSDRIIKLIVMP